MKNVNSIHLVMQSGDTKMIEGLSRQRILVSCKSGVAWVTAKGDPQDYIVEAGKVIEIQPGRGSLLLESLSENLELDINLTA